MYLVFAWSAWFAWWPVVRYGLYCFSSPRMRCGCTVAALGSCRAVRAARTIKLSPGLQQRPVKSSADWFPANSRAGRSLAHSREKKKKQKKTTAERELNVRTAIRKCARGRATKSKTISSDQNRTSPKRNVWRAGRCSRILAISENTFAKFVTFRPTDVTVCDV